MPLSDYEKGFYKIGPSDCHNPDWADGYTSRQLLSGAGGDFGPRCFFAAIAIPPVCISLVTFPNETTTAVVGVATTVAIIRADQIRSSATRTAGALIMGAAGTVAFTIASHFLPEKAIPTFIGDHFKLSVGIVFGAIVSGGVALYPETIARNKIKSAAVAAALALTAIGIVKSYEDYVANTQPTTPCVSTTYDSPISTAPQPN